MELFYVDEGKNVSIKKKNARTLIGFRFIAWVLGKPRGSFWDPGLMIPDTGHPLPPEGFGKGLPTP